MFSDYDESGPDSISLFECASSLARLIYFFITLTMDALIYHRTILKKANTIEALRREKGKIDVGLPSAMFFAKVTTIDENIRKISNEIKKLKRDQKALLRPTHHDLMELKASIHAVEEVEDEPPSPMAIPHHPLADEIPNLLDDDNMMVQDLADEARPMSPVPCEMFYEPPVMEENPPEESPEEPAPMEDEPPQKLTLPPRRAAKRGRESPSDDGASSLSSSSSQDVDPIPLKRQKHIDASSRIYEKEEKREIRRSILRDIDHLFEERYPLKVLTLCGPGPATTPEEALENSIALARPGSIIDCCEYDKSTFEGLRECQLVASGRIAVHNEDIVHYITERYNQSSATRLDFAWLDFTGWIKDEYMKAIDVLIRGGMQGGNGSEGRSLLAITTYGGTRQAVPLRNYLSRNDHDLKCMSNQEVCNAAVFQRVTEIVRRCRVHSSVVYNEVRMYAGGHNSVMYHIMFTIGTTSRRGASIANSCGW